MAPNSPFSVAIVGGGIAGLFTAMCLQHQWQQTSPNQQLDIQVYEQAQEYKEIGAGIGVGPNAVRLFVKLGLYDKLDALSSHRSTKGPDFRRYDTGDKIFNWPKPQAAPDDKVLIRLISCARSDLLDLLRGAVEERKAAKLHTGMSCTGLEESGNSVDVRFADGSSAAADLVIACDGIHSTVRRQFVQSQPVYSGQVAYRDVIPLSSLKDWPYESYANMWLAKGSHFFAYPISHMKELNIVAFVDKDESKIGDIKESWTASCDRSEVQADFAGHEEAVQNIMRNMHEKPARWRINDYDPLDKWYYMGGRVILIGDSSHSMLPHLGAGAAQAMESGWVLSRAVSDLFVEGSPFRTIEEMAATFQAARLPRAQKAQSVSRLNGKTYDCQSEDLLDLSFDECCPLLGAKVGQAQKWAWQEEVDLSYEKALDARRDY